MMGWSKFKFWCYDKWPTVVMFVIALTLMTIAVCNLGCLHHYHHMVYDPVDIEALILQHDALEDACEVMRRETQWDKVAYNERIIE